MEALSDAFVSRLSVAYIGHNSRTERPRKTKIDTEIAHVTRDSDTTFKVKGQGHQAALLSSALTCKATAAVDVGKYCYIASVRRCTGAWAPTGEERAGGILCLICAQLVKY